MNRTWMRIHVYVLPIPITFAMAYLWCRWFGSAAFAWYVTLLAVLYGYVVPGIGTNILKKWRFHGPGRIGNYYIHHGFIWAANNLSPALFLSFLGTPEGPLGYGTILRVLLATGAIHAYKGWIYDIALLRYGFTEITSVPRLTGKRPEEAAFLSHRAHLRPGEPGRLSLLRGPAPHRCLEPPLGLDHRRRGHGGHSIPGLWGY